MPHVGRSRVNPKKYRVVGRSRNGKRRSEKIHVGPALIEDTTKNKEIGIGVQNRKLVVSQKEQETKVISPSPSELTTEERTSGGLGVDLVSRMVGVHGSKERKQAIVYQPK